MGVPRKLKTSQGKFHWILRPGSNSLWPSALSSEPTWAVAVPVVPGCWTSLWNLKRWLHALRPRRWLYSQGRSSFVFKDDPRAHLESSVGPFPGQPTSCFTVSLPFSPVGSISAETLDGLTRHTLVLLEQSFSLFYSHGEAENLKFSKSISFILNNSFFSLSLSSQVVL